MPVTITKTGDVALGGIDVRSFKEGDTHELHPDHEKQLVDLGVAKDASEKEAKATVPVPAGDPALADALKVSQAPQAVDTGAVAARVVADGVTHDSEAGTTPGSTNEEGPNVTHAQDLVNSEAVKAGDEAKKADEPKAHAKPHGKK